VLTAVGYGLAAFTKPVFPLATGVGWLIFARFVDRIGKGIRGAPRDALVADITPADLRGASFGLRQSLDTVGAFLGPLAAVGLMLLTADSFTTVFWIAVIPAFFAFGLLLVGVEEPAQHLDDNGKPVVRLADAKYLSGLYWAVVAVGAALTLARFSEAFLVLRSQNVGLPAALVPIVMVVMNVVYAAAAYPAGAASDRLGRTGVLLFGVGFLIAADAMLALASSISLVMIGVVFWGLHMGFTQGLLTTLVADTAPTELRGTAFGVLNFASGIAILGASIIAGGLWDLYGPAATFLTGAAVTSVALIGLLLVQARSATVNS